MRVGFGRRGAVLGFGGLIASTGTVRGQTGAEWPTRPVRLVVAYPPGGPTDILARVVAQRLTQELPQPIVVENRGGANGAIGSEAVARAAPDGTVFLANASAHVIVPHLQRVPYDALADFAPVSAIAAVPLMLVVTNGLPVRSVPELIAYAKANPGRLSYASSSAGGSTHLAGELFKRMAGVDMAHVPYRGAGQALPDVVAGNTQLMFDSMASSAGLVREGRLRALAVTTETRVPAFPELPTIAEAGPLPGYAIASWYGLWAPARTPPGIVARLQQAIAAALRVPEVVEKLASLGAVPVGDTPEAFARFCRAESEKYGRLVREAGITAD
jgi:tripartite-type tricarboxylate transporter receptor subunit TctC